MTLSPSKTKTQVNLVELDAVLGELNERLVLYAKVFGSSKADLLVQTFVTPVYHDYSTLAHFELLCKNVNSYKSAFANSHVVKLFLEKLVPVCKSIDAVLPKPDG